MSAEHCRACKAEVTRPEYALNLSGDGNGLANHRREAQGSRDVKREMEFCAVRQFVQDTSEKLAIQPAASKTARRSRNREAHLPSPTYSHHTVPASPRVTQSKPLITLLRALLHTYVHLKKGTSTHPRRRSRGACVQMTTTTSISVGPPIPGYAEQNA